MLSVSILQVDVGNTDYYSTGFRNVIEDHLTFLKNYTSTKIIPLDPHQELLHLGSFYSLLNSLSYNQDLWWIIMRVNGLHNETSYTKPLSTLYIPERYMIDLLNRRFMNTKMQ